MAKQYKKPYVWAIYTDDVEERHKYQIPVENLRGMRLYKSIKSATKIPIPSDLRLYKLEKEILRKRGRII